MTGPDRPTEGAEGELPQIEGITLLEELARGGMGVVYRGKQDFLNRKVAVKMLSAELTGPVFVARFRREAQILADIKHPHIVACYAAGKTRSGQSYLVMELVEGPNLRAWIREHGPLPVSVALRLARALAQALGHAFELGVIHRDIKPENILLESATAASMDPRFPFVPKLVDLGLARMKSTGKPSSLLKPISGPIELTVQGEVMGTPSTMSPEQYEDPDSVDFLSDIYGLGCVLFEMLTGHSAYRGTQLEISRQKLEPYGPDPCRENPTIPAEVGRLVTRMLAFDRKQRPQGYTELETELVALLQRCTASPVTAPERTEARRKAAGPEPASPAADAGIVAPGRVLAQRFEIRERLGAGGMGEVFRAFDRHRREEIAVKVILPQLVEREDLRQRFLDEATLVSSLSHPNVVKCHDVHQDGSLFFLTMELLHGRTLRDRIVQVRGEGKTFAVSEVQRIGTALLDALDHVHRHRPNRRIIHRDVKPENVYLCDDGRILLMDFGIARHDAFDKRTVTGTAMGTAYYMAPEQIAGVADIDQRADQFSAAVVIYELLTGKLPTGMTVPIRTLRPDAPKELAAAVERAMSQERESRFPDVASFLQALRAGTAATEPGTRRTRRLLKVGLAALVLVAGLGLTFRGQLFVALEQWIVGVQKEREVDARLAELAAQYRSLEDLAKSVQAPLPAEFVQQHEADLRAVAQAVADGKVPDALKLVDAAGDRCTRRGADIRQGVQRRLPALEQQLAKLQEYGSTLDAAVRTQQEKLNRAGIEAAGRTADPAQRVAAEFQRVRTQFELAEARQRQEVWSKGASGPLAEAATNLTGSRKSLIEGTKDLASLAQDLGAAEQALNSATTYEQLVETTRSEALARFLRDAPELQGAHERVAQGIAGLEGARSAALPRLRPKLEELLRASLASIEIGDHDAARRHLADAAWLQGADVVDPWYEAAAATLALQQRNPFVQPEGDETEGPLAWLLRTQAPVEAALLGLARNHDLSSWQSALAEVREFAALAEEHAALAARLEDANRRQLLPKGDAEASAAAMQRSATAIWRREAVPAREGITVARNALDRNVGLPELREQVLAFLARVKPVLDAVATIPPIQSRSAELARSLEQSVRDGTGDGVQLESGREAARVALLRDFSAWEAGQAAGQDARVLELTGLAEPVATAPAEVEALAAVRRGVSARDAQRDECAAAKAAMDALAAVDEGQQLPKLQQRRTRAAELEAERAGPACTRARLGEIARELRELRDGAAEAAVAEALAAAAAAPMERRSGFRALLTRLRALQPGAADRIDALLATLTRAAPDGFAIDETAGFSAEGHPLRIQHQKTGMYLRFVPAGSFQMGAAADERDSKSNERPRHVRTIREAFYLGETEVTEAEWVRAGAQQKAPARPSDMPMDRMTLAMAREFLRAAGDELRLPSETEWEYACRAGTETPYWFGKDLTSADAVFDTGKPEAARSRKANPWGFHHMHGNLFEICEDTLRPYPLPDQPTRTADAGSSKRVIRGGSYSDTRSTCRSAFRREINLDNGMPGHGMRAARTAPP